MVNKHEPHQGCCLIHSHFYGRFSAYQNILASSMQDMWDLRRDCINNKQVKDGT